MLNVVPVTRAFALALFRFAASGKILAKSS